MNINSELKDMISIVRDEKLTANEKYEQLIVLQNSDPVRYDIKQNFKTKSLGYTSVAISALEYEPDLFIRLTDENLIDVKNIHCSKNGSNTMSVILPLLYLNKSKITGEIRSEIVKKLIIEDKVIYDKLFTTSGYLPKVNYSDYRYRDSMCFGKKEMADNLNFIDILLCQNDLSVLEFMLRYNKADFFIQSKNKNTNIADFSNVTIAYDKALKENNNIEEIERYFDILNGLGFGNTVPGYFNLHSLILDKLSKNPNIKEKEIIASDFIAFSEKPSYWASAKKFPQIDIVKYYEMHLDKIKDMNLLLRMIDKSLVRNNILDEKLNIVKDMARGYLSNQEREILNKTIPEATDIAKDKILSGRI